MLIFGDYKCMPSVEIAQFMAKNGIVIYNLSAYVQDCLQLTDLLPNSGVDCSNEENFDMSYFDYIFNNERPFMALLSVMMNIYNGSNVYIIINHTEFYDKLAESLAEIIKQRYGYCSFFINEAADYEWVTNNYNYGEFSINGLYNLDNDKKLMMGILSRNGKIVEEDYD